jgi:hypothetical protein
MIEASSNRLAFNLPEVNEAHREILGNAKTILVQSTLVAESFFASYMAFGGTDSAEVSEQEQDLLRAMLVFSCSGLDAVVKQLIHDSLAAVVDCSSGAQREFQKFVERRLRKGGADIDGQEQLTPNNQRFDSNLLAALLVHRNPRSELLALLKKNLTSDSLQSRDQLLRVAAQFAITKDEVLANDAITKSAFEVRNQIIHEMDVDLNHSKRRRQRAAVDMISYTENMIETSARFIGAVQTRLSEVAQ